MCSPQVLGYWSVWSAQVLGTGLSGLYWVQVRVFPPGPGYWSVWSAQVLATGLSGLPRSWLQVCVSPQVLGTGLCVPPQVLATGLCFPPGPGYRSVCSPRSWVQVCVVPQVLGTGLCGPPCPGYRSVCPPRSWLQVCVSPQVLATGLSGLYSALPARLQVCSEDWHCLEEADWLQVINDHMLSTHYSING